MSVILKMNSTQRILAQRKLQKGGEAHIFFTKQCAKAMNNFVPFDTGRLKDMNIELGSDFVKYNAPYARIQFYTNAGNGKGGENNGGQRGKHWEKKMWISKGNGIVKKVAGFIGGRSD